MKILTWNVNKGKEIWQYLLNDVKPDVCLLQEYSGNTDATRPVEMRAIHSCVKGKPNYWDTVIATTALSITDLGQSNCPGRVMVGRITLSDHQTINVINIHAQSLGGYYTKWTEKLLDELEPFIMANKDSLILGGDLNMGVFFDKREGVTTSRDLIDRITSYGLRMYPETEQQTYRHLRKLEPKYPDDYLFISKRWEAKSCEVIYDDRINELSDHNPVVVTI